MTQNACKPATAPLDVRTGSAAYPLGVRPLRSTDFLGNSEPSLDEMLSDEVIRRVMARDGIAAEQLLSLLDDMRARLG